MSPNGLLKRCLNCQLKKIAQKWAYVYWFAFLDVAAPVGEGRLHAHGAVEPLEVGGALDGPRAEPVQGRG